MLKQLKMRMKVNTQQLIKMKTVGLNLDMIQNRNKKTVNIMDATHLKMTDQLRNIYNHAAKDRRKSEDPMK